MSNLGLREFCRKSGLDLICTDVGDRNVLEKMIDCDYVIGGEQSGHTIFRDYATTGDGELTALQFLQVLKESGASASQLSACCAQYPQVLMNVKVPADRGAKERIMEHPELLHAIAEEEARMGEEGRILVRPSGTEALIRVMVEAKTVETASAVGERLVNIVNKL